MVEVEQVLVGLDAVSDWMVSRDSIAVSLRIWDELVHNSRVLLLTVSSSGDPWIICDRKILDEGINGATGRASGWTELDWLIRSISLVSVNNGVDTIVVSASVDSIASRIILSSELTIRFINWVTEGDEQLNSLNFVTVELFADDVVSWEPMIRISANVLNCSGRGDRVMRS